mmetsp:Transcript_25068/g.54025  ORF Transcript_25068/g.54025 Transcript_25068/m.54025 type:complete len:110 (-) Transcript_25068:76-405(-)
MYSHGKEVSLPNIFANDVMYKPPLSLGHSFSQGVMLRIVLFNAVWRSSICTPTHILFFEGKMKSPWTSGKSSYEIYRLLYPSLRGQSFHFPFEVYMSMSFQEVLSGGSD